MSTRTTGTRETVDDLVANRTRGETMTDLKIEWAPQAFVGDNDEGAYPAYIPVVRLDQMDALIGELVWAVALIQLQTISLIDYKRAGRILESPLVQAWRARQKEKNAW